MNNKVISDNGFPYSVLMPVRITDINYGKHLGHVSIVGIFHNARVLFLNENGLDEMDIEGTGLILLNSGYSFQSEASFNSKLLVSVGIGEYSKLKFNFIFKAVNHETGEEVTSGREELACFDYSKRKITRIPPKFLDFCSKTQINNSKVIAV